MMNFAGDRNVGEASEGRFLPDLSLLQFTPMMMLMAQAAISKVDNVAHLLGAGRRRKKN